MKTKVLKALKPRIASLGFKKDDVEGVAEMIASNLKIDEDAPEDEVNAAVNTEIDAVMPSLRLTQQIVNRRIESARTAEQAASVSTTTKSVEETKSVQPDAAKQEEAPVWFQQYQEKVEKRFSEIQQEKDSQSYSALLTSLTGDIGDDFRSVAAGGRQFKSKEEVEEFAEKLNSAWTKTNQEKANDALAGSPTAQASNGETPNAVDTLANSITTGTKQIVEQNKQ